MRGVQKERKTAHYEGFNKKVFIKRQQNSYLVFDMRLD